MMTGSTPFSDEKLGSTYNNILEHKVRLDGDKAECSLN